MNHQRLPLPQGLDTYEAIAARATNDPAFRDGLITSAHICRANNGGDIPCPPGILAVYFERLAEGQQP